MKEIQLRTFEDAVKGLAIRGIIVLQDDRKLLHRQYVPQEAQNQYSVTKSFTATAAAFALQEGLFTLEDAVLDWFVGDAPAHPSQKLRDMKVRDLMTMTMGFPEPLLMGGGARAAMLDLDWVRLVLHTEVTDEPGTVFCYSNAGPYLLGILIQRRSGMDLIEYLTPRLFEPTGIRPPVPERDGTGKVFGAGGMVMRLDDLAGFGQFYLHRGVVNGQRLLPDGWFDAATSSHVTVREPDEELGTGYGYLFWTMPGGYRADGKYGQYCIILPGKNAVIAVNSMERGNARDILRAVVRHIIPQL